jgi:hypothetical protein
VAEYSYQLYVRRGPMPGEMFVLNLPTLIAGRDPLADIIVRDPEVSRNHARLILTENGYEIQDMGSTNGTFINGTPLRGEPHLLAAGELITLGSNVVLEYQVTEVEAGDPLATMIKPDEPAAPDRPLPQATGQLGTEAERARDPEDFSAFDLFNVSPSGEADEADADPDFEEGTVLDDLLSAGAPAVAQPFADPSELPPQTDSYAASEEPAEFSPPPRPRPRTVPPAQASGPREGSTLPPSPPPPPPAKRNTLLTILLIVLIVLVALCCFFLLLTVYFLQDAGLIGWLPAINGGIIIV